MVYTGRIADLHMDRHLLQDDTQRTQALPARALDHRGLRCVFFDLVGRPPYVEEAEKWLGSALHELVDHLLAAPETWRHWWEEQLYYFLLVDTFRPADSSLAEVPVKIAEGRLSVRDGIHRIALCSSFDLRNPGADTFVTVVMEQICGITVQDKERELEQGKRAYDGDQVRFMGEAINTQSDVVRACVAHEDAAEHLVRREYERFVREQPERRDLKRWTRELHRDPYTFGKLVRDWMLSAAYASRMESLGPKPNRLFVRGLYVDLLDRLPSQDEIEPMRYALDGLADSRPLRSVIVRLLLDSGDVRMPQESGLDDRATWVTGRFQRYLGREPQPTELEAFTKILAGSDCHPSTIAYALLTSAEYHLY